VRLFLRAGAVIKYVLRAASTLKNTDGEQRALHEFSRMNLYFFIEKKRFERGNLADIVQPMPAAYSQLCLVGDDVKFHQVASREFQYGTLGGRSRRSKAF